MFDWVLNTSLRNTENLAEFTHRFSDSSNGYDHEGNFSAKCYFKSICSSFKERTHEYLKSVIEDLLDTFGGITNFFYVETRNES